MQPFENETNSGVSAIQCAHELLDVAPLLMRILISRLRNNHGRDLIMPQFRVLVFLQNHPESSVSEVADFCGLHLPCMSRHIDVLVDRQLLTRNQDPNDRRRLQLSLTPEGLALLKQTHEEAQQGMAKRLESCSPQQRQAIIEAMNILRPVFQPEPRTIRNNPTGHILQNLERGNS